MKAWLRARLIEPSTYGGVGGLLIVACFATFSFWYYWRFCGYAAGICFVAQAVIAERRGAE